MTRWHVLYAFLVVAGSMGAVALALCVCESLLKHRYQRQHAPPVYDAEPYCAPVLVARRRAAQDLEREGEG